MNMQRKTIILIVLPMLNLLFMHYFFYYSRCLEWLWQYSEIINVFSVVFDVFVLLFLSLLLTKGRLKPAIAITQAITLIWSFVNVMYGKFFFQYMSLSAIGEAHGLGEGLVINSILSAFHWYDLYFLFSCLIFILFYRRCKKVQYSLRHTFRLLFVPLASLLLTLLTYSAYHFTHPHYRHNWELLGFRTKEFLFDSVRGGTPNLVHFQTGCIRVAAFELYDLFSVKELTEEQREEIKSYYSNHSKRSSNHQRNPNIKNVMFILLESFLSASIDLEVDGKEITPFLNSLKRDSSVYYNGNMISDIGCGESGDGQFIYMTGLLPLKNKMTVGQVKDNTLPAFPIILKENLGINYSEIISPTVPNLWQQADMNVAYGFNHAYWLDDIVYGQSKPIDDELIFKFASQHIITLDKPFFSLLLSLSTHAPYNKHVGPDFLKGNQSIIEEYKNYLNSCHYLDEQLASFIKTLKDNGLYDNTLIVIASDHFAHLNLLKMDGKLSNHTPLFVINGNISQGKSWKGEFHQLDIYTTLIDILAINEPWRGLGHTLLTTKYVNSVNDKASDISYLVIEGDYFAQ